MATVREATSQDVAAVTEFLSTRLRVAVTAFQPLFEYRWLPDKPNLGYLLEHEGRVRGFVGGIYSVRHVGGRLHRFCNVHSFAVDPDCRASSLLLLGRLLAEPDCTYTCFSASPTAQQIFKFFKFEFVDAAKVVFTPFSMCRLFADRRTRLHHAGAVFEQLAPIEQQICRDHRGYRCGQFLLEAGGSRSYFVTVRRGRGVRAFADVLFATNPALLAQHAGRVLATVAAVHRTTLFGLDARLVSYRAAGTFVYSRLRPLAFRSPDLRSGDIDGLYSELVPLFAAPARGAVAATT